MRIVLLGFAIRFITGIFQLGDILAPSLNHWAFGSETGRVASSLAMGHGFSNPLFVPTGPSAWLAPVFPLILAGIFRVFGIFSLSSAVATLVLNCTLSSLTSLPIRRVANELFGEPTASYSAWAWALFPYSIYFTATVVWDTTLSTLLMTLLVWATMEVAKRNSLGPWAAYGSLCGAAAMTNPVLMAPVPLLGGWLIYRRYQAGRKLLGVLAVAAVLCGVTVSPWLIRNYRTFHQPFLLKNNFWLEVTTGNLGSHRHWWEFDQHPSQNGGELLEMARVGEKNYMAEKKTAALAFIKQHSMTYAELCLRRLVFIWTGFWSFRLDYLVDESLDPVNIVFCSTLSILAFFGIRRAWKQCGAGIVPCLAVVLCFPVVYYLAHPFPYYREPMDPILVLFATFAAWPVFLTAWKNSWLVRMVTLATGTEIRPLEPVTVAEGLHRAGAVIGAPTSTTLGANADLAPFSQLAESEEEEITSGSVR